MKVNFDKSVAVLLLRGSAAAGLKLRFVKWHKDRYVLLLGTDRVTGREVRLPLEDTMEYLGAVLSYGPMEAQTVAARASKAWANYTKLRPMLRTTSVFSIKQRIKLFQACVVPAMLYGIIGVGVTAASLRTIQSIFARMLRKILRVHEHGISNRAVLDRAEIQPEAQLRHLLEGKARTLNLEGHQSPELRAPAQQRAQEILREMRRLDAIPRVGLLEIDRTGEAVTCPICGLEYHNQKSLEAHITAKHPQVHRDARTPFDRRAHTLFGLPQCRLCRQSLYDWASMERQHITEGRCPRLKSAAALGHDLDRVMQQVMQEELESPPKPPSSASHLKALPTDIPQQLLECSLSQLSENAEVISRYKTSCILCAQLVKASGHIKNHWQQTHRRAWEHAQQDAISGARSLRSAFQRPCQFCGSNARQGSSDTTHHATKCSPLFQVLVVRKLYMAGELSQHLHAVRGAALKQREKEPQYKTLERTGIQALLCGRMTSASTTSGLGTTVEEAKGSCSSSVEVRAPVARVPEPASNGQIQEAGYRRVCSRCVFTTRITCAT